MSRSFAMPLAALLLATSLHPVPAQAAGGDLNSSEATLVISAVLTVSIPLAASTGLSQLSSAPFKASARHSRSKRTPAQPVPAMEVKEVNRTPDGDWTVALQVPGQAEQTATLAWPARTDNPAAGFVVGETVAFVPTPAGSGWNVHDRAGKSLAYVPTDYAAADNASAVW